MSWYAKKIAIPFWDTGGTEWTANLWEIHTVLSENGFTDVCISGMIGNMTSESGLNPWAWEGNSYFTRSKGYGLFQFTPASGYLNLGNKYGFFAPYYTGHTAKATDGVEQLNVFINDTLGKWASTCWRDSWDTTTFADLWAIRETIMNTWGSNRHLTMAQFKTITDLEAATFAFLACYEGPAIPNLSPRYSNAQTAYKVITGETPPSPDPDPPEPTPPTYSRIPIWMMKKLSDTQFQRRC